jgi:uncharacterized protein with ParB-like and HNH nuclease domain
MEPFEKQKVFEKIFKEHLKIETYSKSINSLFSPRLLNRINYKPYYQRNYVWDNNKATYFIESILIGTEVPPLIFFDNNLEIEVIDGRQRFETIQRFMNGEFSLTTKGLNILKQLKKCTYDDLAKSDPTIIDVFLDAKIRIIEFKLVNEPPLDKFLEDRVKKEIFSRYNTGITPLKKSEIDNAIYDEDDLSNLFKEYLEENIKERQKIYSTFFIQRADQEQDPPIETIMSFIRKYLVLPLFPINYFSRGTGRTEILSKLYEYITDSIEDEKSAVADFFKKVDFVSKVKKYSLNNSLKSNRLAMECLLWGIGIIELEEIEFDYSDKFIKEFCEYIDLNLIDFTEIDYAFNKEVLNRHLSTSIFLEKYYNVNLDLYITANNEVRERIKTIRTPCDTSAKLSELESLRLNKPEPSKNSIDDIIRTMQRRKFLVRPSYQRKEVINQTKASSIIESVLLDITLPALFVYKRIDGVSEVIDGQQRLLTLLGFIGASYIDNKNNTVYSKNHKFNLRKLKILTELEGKRFDQISEELKNKIYDFQLYVVEIDQNQNPDFDPIDLFIRLNDKPYPIRENSFEMWNSWVDLDIIKLIKDFTNSTKSWLYVKQIRSSNDRDRMETEELVTSLAFLEYIKLTKDTRRVLDIYQKTNRINARISDKAVISSSLLIISEKKDKSKDNFIEAIKQIRSFFKKLKYVLLDCDKNKEDLFEYLRVELDEIFKAGKDPKYFRRTMQDFYLLWFILNEINLEMIKLHRIEMKKEITQIFRYFKNIPEEDWKNGDGYNKFFSEVEKFKQRYTIVQRKIVLTETEKFDLIRKQGGLCGISKVPVFLGDDIEVDHQIPISKGGADSIDNLQITHKEENRSKGSKI